MFVDNIIPHVNFSLERKCFKGWSLPERTIADHEFVLILGGKGSFTLEDRVCPVRKGQLFYFYPGLVHSGDTDQDDPMHFYAVHFEFDTVSVTEGRRAYGSAVKKLPLPGVSMVSNPHRCTEMLKGLYTAWSEKRPGYGMRCRSLLLAFIDEAVNRFYGDEPSHMNRMRVDTAIDYMVSRFSQPMTLDDLCRQVKLSPTYFSFIFKQYTGYSPMQYLNRIRVDRAKDILLNSECRIRDAAVQAGFSDEFYFSRQFRKQEGISPTEFVRKYHRNIVHEK